MDFSLIANIALGVLVGQILFQFVRVLFYVMIDLLNHPNFMNFMNRAHERTFKFVKIVMVTYFILLMYVLFVPDASEISQWSLSNPKLPKSIEVIFWVLGGFVIVWLIYDLRTSKTPRNKASEKQKLQKGLDETHNMHD